MASRAPTGGALGEIGVDVAVDLRRLFSGFNEGHAASDRFDRMLTQRLGATMKNLENLSGSLEQSQKKVARSFDEAGRSAQRFARDMDTARNRSTAAARQIESNSNSIKGALLAGAAAITAAFGVHQVIALVDSYTSFTNRLRSAGLEGDILYEKQEKLYQLAQKYGTQLEGMGSLYGRMAQTQKELGASAGELELATEGAAAAIRIYGAGTAEQRGALIQFSQLLGGARVQAQEFNSINDGARPILQAVANGIDRFGGSVSKLRSEIINGNLMSKEFFAGFLKGVPDLIEQADKLPLTIGASLTTLNNALGRYIGQTNEAWSATERISAGIAFLADNLNIIMPILGRILIAIGARYVSSFVAATAATIAKTAADVRATIAANALGFSQARLAIGSRATTRAMAAATASVGWFAVATGVAARGAGALSAMMGGALGFALAAIITAVIVYRNEINGAREAVENYNKHQQEANNLLEEERQRASQAGSAMRSLQNAHRDGTTAAREFAGATGDAADALKRQATEAKNARLELLKKAAEESLADALPLRRQIAHLEEMKRMGAGGSGDATMAQYAALPRMKARAEDAERRWRELMALHGRESHIPIDDPRWVGPFQQTGGRDIPAEIKQFQTQLVAATAAKNEIAMKTLLAEIKLRERILELMRQGLSLEVASSTAAAEKLKKGEGSTASQEPLTQFGNPLDTMNVRHRYGETRGQRQHGGVDLRASVGTIVRAVADGVVKAAGPRGDYGNLIELSHGRGTATRYGHLSRMAVEPGQQVRKGDVIGYSGGEKGAPGSGNSQAPHLHYEVRRNGRAVNPFKGRGFPTDDAAIVDEAERIEQARIQNEEQYNRALEQLNSAILSAKGDQTLDAEKLAQLERDRINLERDREKQETLNRQARGDYDEAQAKQLLEANEALRTLQLAGHDLKERERKEKEALQLKDAEHGRLLEGLKSQQDLARTAAERRAIERRILKAQEDYERAVLEAKIKSPFTTAIDRAVAQGDLSNLDRKYGASRGKLGEETRSDVADLDKSLGGNFAKEAELRDLRREQEDRLQVIKEALEARIITEQEAADRIVEINRDANAKIREAEAATAIGRLQLAQQIADSMGQIASAVFGEHSRAARAMFIVSKAFATAEAILQLQVAIAKAMASAPFPANLPAIAQVVALGATIIGNIASIAAQFDVGGWTGDGPTNKAAGVVHGQEYVVRAGPAARFRADLDMINSGRDPTSSFRRAAPGSGSGGAGGMGGMKVAIHNHAPGVRHEARQISAGEIAIIATEVVEKKAPEVVAKDLGRPNSRMAKAMKRTTTARPRRDGR